MTDTFITVIGNMTDDPELKFLASGVALAKFRIASTPRVKDRDTGEWKDGEALFLSCTAFRQMAENIAESMQRGTRVVVQGRLKQRSYEKDGEKRTVYELDVEEIGPSLRYATAKVQKMGRSSQGQAPTRGDDPWGSAAPAAPTGGSSFDEPPF